MGTLLRERGKGRGWALGSEQVLWLGAGVIVIVVMVMMNYCVIGIPGTAG